VKTAAGKREVPYDKYGVILGAVRQMWTRNNKFRQSDDLVFANRAGKALDRHNLLHRHVKPVAEGLGLPKTIDFRSFRTMHASLMVARGNMGHAGSSGSITLEEKKRIANPLKGLSESGTAKQWEPFSEPQVV
jgi:hypothetical protein